MPFKEKVKSEMAHFDIGRVHIKKSEFLTLVLKNRVSGDFRPTFLKGSVSWA